jgi:hypothetical protein
VLRTLVPLAALTAALGFHAAMGQTYSQADAQADAAAMQAMSEHQTCVLNHAKAADDHVSEPAKIAATIKDACRAEEDRFLAAMKGFAARHPGFEAPPAQITDKDRLGVAEAMVIEARKSQSSAGGDHPH